MFISGDATVQLRRPRVFNLSAIFREKYLLTIKEAGEYFNIGVKKMRRLAEENLGVFSVYSGNRYLVIRTKFEEFLCNTSTF